MDPSEKKRRPKIVIRWVVAFALYVFSIGPIAWATNDGLHPRYLPDEINWIYLPLAPLMQIELINKAFYFYTAELWGGFPAGYTTL